MTDLIKRLRLFAAFDPDQAEAADRIEELEAEVNRLVKSRNKWGKLYNQTLEKFCLSVMSNSEYVKIIDAKNAEQADRIEQLEAALREIAQNNYGLQSMMEEGTDTPENRAEYYAGQVTRRQNTARAALAGEKAND